MSHDAQVEATATVEYALSLCRSASVDSLAVFDMGVLIGLWTQQLSAMVIGTVFGYALYHKKPVTQLIHRDPMILRNGEPIEPFLEKVMNRPLERFTEPVVLFDKDGTYIGLIPLRALAHLQSNLLAKRMDQLQANNEVLARARDVAVEHSQAKAAFLSTISHELLTPMNGILGSLELMRDTQMDGEQTELADLARGSAERLLGSLTDILTFTELESAKLRLNSQPCYLEALLRGVEARLLPLATGKNLKLRSEVTAVALPPVVVDAARLGMVLQHLLGNAIKFSASGEIVTTITRESGDGNEISVRFEVRDQGVGMDRKNMEFLFAPFSQGDSSHKRRYEGLGIGLVVSQQLIHQMGGCLQCESELNQGCRVWFSLRLPIAQGAQADPEDGGFQKAS